MSPDSVTSAPVVLKMPPPPASVKPRSDDSCTPLVKVMVALDSASPSDTPPAAAPSAASCASEIAPPLTTVPPVKRLVPLSVSVPVPALTSEPLPLMLPA